ncbi:hypothetical protein FW781_22160 [Chryseobacterium panacisoli]|uniref:Uncharacterized protein n=1 Tax=Chryseobacterium panacisoli TaxID=1807141 RepID=A0A5D8ZBB9_9FLAO|nr:hypothetical protein [Chryseobacterium panacisoli]TZF92225.1 hypothetical protein FW781_22160 [Chryseobacterium panacisoli]
MSKNVVFPYVTFNRFIDESTIKKLCLFYDNIFISEGRFNIISDINTKEVTEENYSLHYEKAVWDFLKDNNVVKEYPYLKEKFDSSNEDVTELTTQLKSLFEKERSKKNWPKTPTEEQLKEMKEEYFNHFFLSHDISIRLDSIHLNKLDNTSEFYPVLRTADTLKSDTKKEQIIQFILNDIPEPDYNTSWDHIIEYRSDESVRNKYLALMNWVNKAANSNLRLSELKDEYDFLYSDYMQQFKLHKMKYNNSKLEVILSSTINFIANISTGNYVSSLKDLFQFNIKNATLLQEESKIPGKEIAYIYHTKMKFGK